ncbi:MAG: hypothetical protein WCP24_00130 [bacterium]
MEPICCVFVANHNKNKKETRSINVEAKVLKLGTVCRDKATNLEGTLTHWIMDMSKGVSYLFQPKGLDENDQPVKKLYLEMERLNVKDSDFETVEVPFEIIGTVVTNKSSGFVGMAVEFIRHINGCFHVVIQPKGMSAKTKTPIQKNDFDLRDCTGSMIVELTKKALAESRRKTPSPTGDTAEHDLPKSLSSPLIRD